ncbi:MAG: excinuclease ABC subunit UvrA, partial [Muribaculaceae bacterium]|nr:excinuclease ABC subunit UvrA [Muribaculaceae bacterium]
MGNKYSATDSVNVFGARVHNLKNIDVTIPHNTLCVITGLSGCGKSSLAFDTIFAEGQRRYIETFSAYARNMLGALERPDVDNITGLSPVISIEQKTINKNPRSTIGTTTEIYDFFRLLYARLGEARSYISGKPMEKYTKDRIISLLLEKYNDRRIMILSPLVKNRKGHYKELFDNLHKKGYLNVRVDGVVKEIIYGMKLDRYKIHTVELVVDRLRVKSQDIQRLRSTVEEALKQGGKQMMVLDMEDNTVRHYSQLLMDSENGISYPEAAPHNFSFNSPQGYCNKCKGIGTVNIVDVEKIIPDNKLSIYDGGILPLGKYKNSIIFWQIEAICRLYGKDLKSPIGELPDDALSDILNGTDQRLDLKNATLSTTHYSGNFEGLVKYIEMQQSDDAGSAANKWSGQFFSKKICPECNGNRLNKIALSYYIDDKNIADVASMDIAELYEWTKQLENKIEPNRRIVAREILKEINSRLSFLLDVGLDYLSLNRSSASLSGGESQRIRLATQIGSKLVNVLYILDEPSIGLHQRDNVRLIKSLKQLRDTGNSIIVVEHDKDIMEESDYIIDIGPGAGRHGGEVVFQGNVNDLKKTHTLTASYLNGNKKIPIPNIRRKGNGLFLSHISISQPTRLLRIANTGNS